MTKKSARKPLHEHAWVKPIITAVRSGQLLCCTYATRLGGGKEAIYHLEPSQRRVATKSAEKAIASGVLTPRQDGLFGTSQTWGASHD